MQANGTLEGLTAPIAPIGPSECGMGFIWFLQRIWKVLIAKLEAIALMLIYGRDCRIRSFVVDLLRYPPLEIINY